MLDVVFSYNSRKILKNIDFQAEFGFHEIRMFLQFFVVFSIHIYKRNNVYLFLKFKQKFLFSIHLFSR